VTPKAPRSWLGRVTIHPAGPARHLKRWTRRAISAGAPQGSAPLGGAQLGLFFGDFSEIVRF
jgi:hypothetical protein